jgi:hypothetical protein
VNCHQCNTRVTKDDTVEGRAPTTVRGDAAATRTAAATNRARGWTRRRRWVCGAGSTEGEAAGWWWWWWWWGVGGMERVVAGGARRTRARARAAAVPPAAPTHHITQPLMPTVIANTFAASLRTDNCPQPKEAQLLSHAVTSD